MKKFPIVRLIIVLSFSLSCAISYEGINFGEDEDINHIYEMTETAAARVDDEPLTGGIPANRVDVPEETSEPASNSGLASSSDASPSGEPVEYAVSGSNNGCICSVNGNMTVSLTIQEEKLTFALPDGTSHEYVKIRDQTYQRSYMGYYILVDSSSGKETQVDEERHDVIILTKNGFIREHYQGTESTPCCYHTFSNVNSAP